MPTHYPHVLSFVSDHPWAILESKLQAICELLEFRSSGGLFSREELDRYAAGSAAGRVSRSKGAIAVIPVYGTITQRANLLSDFSGGTTTQLLGSSIAEAMGNDGIKAVVFDFDSPGGSTDGVTELAAKIRSFRGQKPMISVANSLMASAAYWLASQTDEVVASPSSMVGSIGVYGVHMDESKALEQAGVTPTVIKAGKYKAEGLPVSPLSEEAVAALQAQVEEFYTMFVNDVAAGRGVAPSAVRNGYGEGRVLTAAAAKAAGLVDRIATLEDTINRLGAQGGVVTPNPARAAADSERTLALIDMALATAP